MKNYDKMPSLKDHSDTDEKNHIRSQRYALMSLTCGAIAFFSLSLSFSAAILIGMSANVLFVLSKEEGQPRNRSAVIGLILGIISVVFGVIEFFCLVKVYHMISDPQYAPFFDQAMQLYDSILDAMK